MADLDKDENIRIAALECATTLISTLISVTTVRSDNEWNAKYVITAAQAMENYIRTGGK